MKGIHEATWTHAALFVFLVGLAIHHEVDRRRNASAGLLRVNRTQWVVSCGSVWLPFAEGYWQAVRQWDRDPISALIALGSLTLVVITAVVWVKFAISRPDLYQSDPQLQPRRHRLRVPLAAAVFAAIFSAGFLLAKLTQPEPFTIESANIGYSPF